MNNQTKTTENKYHRTKEYTDKKITLNIDLEINVINKFRLRLGVQVSESKIKVETITVRHSETIRTLEKRIVKGVNILPR